ncbi:hypothetical protein HGB25_02375 [Candidatus Saccharibacteria bacterium]|nr:hypothetical protein [Candidatus Saccharibacteria bacterium]
MVQRSLRHKSILFIAPLVMVIGVLCFFVGLKYVNATDRAHCEGYFFGGTDWCSNGDPVLSSGIDIDMSSQATAKADFIAQIKAKNLSSHTTSRLAGAYIIQTMRGPNASGDWDHEIRASDSDVADWEAKVNNPAIVIKSEEYSASTNTMMNPGGGWSSKDIVSYSGSGSYDSYVFYEGSTVRYVIKKACGNPLGNLSGLPTSLDFTLKPAVSLSTSLIESGGVFDVKPTVENTGSTSSASATYTLVKTITNPSEPGATTSGAGTFPAHSGPVDVLDYTEDDTDYVAGTSICFVLTVSPHSDSDSGSVSSSPPACVLIGKRPSTQVWGGDLLVGANITTGVSIKSGSAFGSWVEYGIFATGSVLRAGSGAAFAGSGLTGNTVCRHSTLTFTNGGNTTCNDAVAKGGYTVPLASDIISSFPGGSSLPAVISPQDYNGTYSTGDITLNTSQLTANHSVIIKSSGTVTISGDQLYVDGPYSNIRQIPQLVIIANKIIINSDVVRVDAWLYATNGSSGIIETCNTGSSTYDLVGIQKLTVDKCNKQLFVNGPVVAKQLWLRRTFGAGVKNDSGQAAEVFNLRANTYLWSLTRVAGGRLRTVSTVELPPRL